MYKLSSDETQQKQSASSKKNLTITLDLSDQVKNIKIADVLKTGTITTN